MYIIIKEACRANSPTVAFSQSDLEISPGTEHHSCSIISSVKELKLMF